MWSLLRCRAWSSLVAAMPLAAALLGTPASSQAAGADTMLNVPDVAAWSSYGPGQTHKLRKDGAVQGGGALRIDVATRPALPSDIGVAAPITGAIAKGDRLVLAFWARIEGAKEGTTAALPAMIQLNTAPFTPVVIGSVTLTGKWTLVSINGTAAEDHAAGSTNINVQLGTAAQTIDLGPAFVMKL